MKYQRLAGLNLNSPLQSSGRNTNASVSVAQAFPASSFGHYKLDNSFPSTARMPFMSPLIIVVIFYYNLLWRYLFKIIYSLVHVLEQYCTVAFAVEVVYFLSLYLFEVCMYTRRLVTML